MRSAPPGARVILVTGGSSGIGLATAHALHDRGDQLALLARDRAALDSAATDMPGALTFACDVTDADAATDAIATPIESFDRLDAIVHAAQVMAYGRS